MEQNEQRGLPFFMVYMVEFAFGGGAEVEFFPVPEQYRPNAGGHPCGVQVKVKVGPDPGDRHFYSAFGPTYIDALKSLLLRAPVSKFHNAQ